MFTVKTWIFSGMGDKSDLLLYICKILATSGKKVLLIDAAIDAKYRHMIGLSHPLLPVMEFAGFDVATGFQSLDSLKSFLQEESESRYDYMILDVERADFIDGGDWHEADACVWVTGYDIWSLRKSAALLEALKATWPDKRPPSLHRVYLHDLEDAANEVIEGCFDDGGVRWLGPPLRMPWDERFFALKIRNEHAGRLSLKPLSRYYKRALAALIQRLSEMDRRDIQQAMRLAGRRGA